MVAHGALEIRVVLPVGPDGRPLPAGAAADYFHPKEGLFIDACGHMLAFSGSANETPRGWLHPPSRQKEILWRNSRCPCLRSRQWVCKYDSRDGPLLGDFDSISILDPQVHSLR